MEEIYRTAFKIPKDMHSQQFDVFDKFYQKDKNISLPKRLLQAHLRLPQ
jgi:hypothetical protein